MRARVNEYAKSAYAGQRGTVIKYGSGRSSWTRGSKYAKFVCLLFSDGHCAGREMWFSTAEIDPV